jgi:methylenetetrahydrofolate dehydrogenase (NADP+)/methenyltetrahydrofolate cyclohydrolase
MDGNTLRDETVARLRKVIEDAGSPRVCLATVLIGGDAPSQIYVASKHKKAQEAGMISVGVHLEEDATQEQVEAEVRKLAADPTVHGILVQLPLPKHLDAEPVLALLPPEKDVDGLTERSMGRLLRGLPGHAPCTPLGVMRLLERYEIPTKGKRVVVIGRSTLTGLPQLLLFLRKGGDATATCTHSHTSPEDLKAYCREADIIVSCVGIARLITAEHVKPGATVIDVGVSRIEAKIVGDVDFDSVQSVAGAITPMPGGTGPMTIGCLLENTLAAAKMLGAFPSK